MYKVITKRLTADFSSGYIKARRQRDDIFKVLKENVNHEFHTQQKYSLKIKEKFYVMFILPQIKNWFEKFFNEGEVKTLPGKQKH